VGLTVGLVLIHGDHLASLSELLEAFGYPEASSRQEVSSVEAAEGLLSDPALGRSRYRMFACSVNGWTVVIDPDLITATDQDACTKVSTDLKTRVFSMVIQESTGTYAYDLYDGRRVKGFLRQDGELVETLGNPFGQQSGFVEARLFDVVIRKEMQELGVVYEDVWRASRYVVLEFKAPEPQPLKRGYWDEIWSEARRQQILELESVASNEKYTEALRLKARDALKAIAGDERRAEWVCKLAEQALVRIDRSFHPRGPP